MSESVVIIPARGGSKRIPRKNVLEFAGVPMIGRSVQTAIQSGIADRVIVSTDDEEIAKVAREHGAETPFMRGKELSDDNTGTTPVVWDAVERLQLNDATVVTLLYATAPLLKPERLKQGYENFLAEQPEFAISVTKCRSAPERALFLTEENLLQPKYEKDVFTRSQDLPDSYLDAGQFYIATAKTWKNSKHPYLARTIAIELPALEVCDIDTQEDWEFAELQFRFLEAQGK